MRFLLLTTLSILVYTVACPLGLPLAFLVDRVEGGSQWCRLPPFFHAYILRQVNKACQVLVLTFNRSRDILSPHGIQG